MEKTTFKEAIVLNEARNSDLVYKEKVTKNKLDRVTVELQGSQSGVMTKIASRYERLEKAIKRMAEKRDELNAKLKENVESLFNAEDVVLTRVVETASFTMTLSKLIKGSEQDPKVVVRYEEIAKELQTLIPDELQEQVDAIIAKYTETSIAADKSPALRVKAKLDENLTEGVVEFIQKVTTKLSSFVRSITKWAIGYDKKLESLKDQVAKAKTAK